MGSISSSYCHTKGPNGGVVSTPLLIKLISLVSSSRHLDSNRKGGCACEEWPLRRSQTEQAQLGLICDVIKCSDAGNGVQITHETLPMGMAAVRRKNLTMASPRSDALAFPGSVGQVSKRKAEQLLHRKVRNRMSVCKHCQFENSGSTMWICHPRSSQKAMSMERALQGVFQSYSTHEHLIFTTGYPRGGDNNN